MLDYQSKIFIKQGKKSLVPKLPIEISKRAQADLLMIEYSKKIVVFCNYNSVFCFG